MGRLVGSARQDEVRAVFVLKEVKVGVEVETERWKSLTCNRTGPDEMRREAKEVRWAAAPVGTDEGARSQEMTQFPQHRTYQHAMRFHFRGFVAVRNECRLHTDSSKRSPNLPS